MSSWYERNTGGRGQIKRALIVPVCDLMVEAARAIEGDPVTDSPAYLLAQKNGLAYEPKQVTRQTVTAMIDDLARGFQANHPVRKYYDCATDRAILMLANEIMKEAGAMTERALKRRRDEQALEAERATLLEEFDAEAALSALASLYSRPHESLGVKHLPHTNSWAVEFVVKGKRHWESGPTLKEAIFAAVQSTKED